MLRLTISRRCLRFDRITNNSYIIISLINIYLQQIFLFFENKSKKEYVQNILTFDIDQKTLIFDYKMNIDMVIK